MPTARAIGNSSGPNSTIAGMPSNTLPSTMKATIDTAMKPTAPPGSARIAWLSVLEKPDCVSPGHGGSRPDDQQDRAGKTGGIDQHWIDPLPVELPIDQKA